MILKLSKHFSKWRALVAPGCLCHPSLLYMYCEVCPVETGLDLHVVLSLSMTCAYIDLCVLGQVLAPPKLNYFSYFMEFFYFNISIVRSAWFV